MSQRQIAAMLKVSPTAVSKSIPNLEKENLITIEKDTNLIVTYVSLNRDSEKTIAFKRVENLKMLYESGLAKFLEDNLPGATIILFGSYSHGEDTTTSDIDIAIIGIKRKNINLEKFGKLLERKININFYNKTNDIPKNLRSNILRGITLIGVAEI